MPVQPLRPIAIANRHPRLRLDRRAVTAVIATLDAGFRILPGDRPHLTRRLPPESKIENPKSKISACPPGEISLVFLTDPALARLHADFLDDPTTTDVITFEGDPALGSAGRSASRPTPPPPTPGNTGATSAPSSPSTWSTAGSTSPATTTSAPPASAACAPPRRAPCSSSPPPVSARSLSCGNNFASPQASPDVPRLPWPPTRTPA